jgi:hypothetical protein
MVFSFQAEVCPIPISVSPTHADFFPVEIACPISPETFSSFVVYIKKLVDERVVAKFYPNLNVKCGVKSHSQIALIVFIEYAKETLFENGRCERVGQDHGTAGRIRQ